MHRSSEKIYFVGVFILVNKGKGEWALIYIVPGSWGLWGRKERT